LGDVDLVGGADCSALVLEGSDRDAEECAGTKGSTHGAAEGRAQGASTLEIRAGIGHADGTCSTWAADERRSQSCSLK
jgi:hypothetical protein